MSCISSKQFVTFLFDLIVKQTKDTISIRVSGIINLLNSQTSDQVVLKQKLNEQKFVQICFKLSRVNNEIVLRYFQYIFAFCFKLLLFRKQVKLQKMKSQSQFESQLQNGQLILSQQDQFENPNFDPIAYLNQRFPDQQSLAGLDQQITKLNSQLAHVNQELIDQIHEHAMMNIEISQEIEKAKSLSKQIIKQIGVIKEKATKSEQIVYDMCKDLKSLDIAKKNLTFSIDALKKFIMMVDALQKLREACENKNYIEVSHLLSAFQELSNYFKKYQQISQIQDLYSEKNAIVEQLHAQIIQDFEAYYHSTSSLNAQNMAAACSVIQILGDKQHRRFIQAIYNIFLKPYQQQFNQAQNAVLQNTQRRFGFIKRKMQEFNSKFQYILPIQWGVDCLILYQFCSITRISLTHILQATSHTVNVAVLMKALQLSLKFQNKITDLMKTKYQTLIKQRATIQSTKSIRQSNKSIKNSRPRSKMELQSLPKFVGSISNSFEPYLMPYIKSQEDALMEGLCRSLQEDKLTQIKVFNSSIVLFHGIKNTIKRASNYSRGNLLLQILKVIKKMFRVYSDKCFEKSKVKDNFEQKICWIINTAEYCKNIIEGVKEVLDNTIDPAFQENINFSDEQQVFSSLISRSIQLFVSILDQKLDTLFSAIPRTNWEKIQEIVDISEYVQETKTLLATNFTKIKDQLQSIYLTLYMDKVVVLIANRFIQNVYKCKKLPSMAFQQLHMDIIELKVTLLSIVKSDQKTYSKEKTFNKYTGFVNKNFTRGQNIIKAIGLNNQQFAQRFEMLMEGAGLSELDKILLVRGNKRTDFPALVKSIQNKSI